MFGDDFAHKSFEKYFRSRSALDYNSYVKANYDVTGYFNNGLLCDNLSVIGRLSNLLAQASRQKLDQRIYPLLKLLIIVPDDDIIQCLGMCERDLSDGFSQLVNYIMTEHEHAIASFKEQLAAKSVRKCPHVLWIQAPYHDHFVNNDARFKFNKSLTECAKLHLNVSTLELKKVWNEHDPNLFLEECHRFTADGYSAYWEAVDRMVRYFDSIYLKKVLDKDNCSNSSKSAYKGGHNTHYGQKDRSDHKGRRGCSMPADDRFRWKNPRLNLDHTPLPHFSQLLPPPPRKY